MGRYSQARRRGKWAELLAALGPPPAPTLSNVGGVLIQDATGGPDSGGFCWLYFSEDPLGPFGVISTVAWDASYQWFEIETATPGYYCATEIGNGIAFSGESLSSNVFQV